MKPMKWLLALLTENLGWKLLSLAIAIVMWVLVASEPELSTFATVRVEYKNLRDDLEIMEIGPEQVTTVLLELRGPSGELRGLGDGGIHPEVILDMSGVRPGERTFPIGTGNVKLSRGVRLVRAKPSDVRFKFEQRVYRTVKIVPRFAGEGRSAFRVGQYSVAPDSIGIAGPASRVARIGSILTDAVDVSSLEGTSTLQVNAFVDDPYVRLLAPPQVRVTVTMQKATAEPKK